jgi:hypothetical protein
LGLLAVASGLFFLGTRERATSPSSTSYLPSGTRAFVDLLRELGYSVALDQSSKPKLRADDLALGFVLEDERFDFGGPPQEPKQSPTEKTLLKHVEEGGRAVLLQVPPDFLSASKLAAGGARKVTLTSGPGSTFAVTKGSIYSGRSLLLNSTEEGYTLGLGEAGAFLRLFPTGKGLVGVVYDATGATNRFLDQEQNAEFYAWLVATLAPNRRIVVLEALHAAPVDPGLLASIGAWAQGAWWQSVLLFLVIVFTLGKRFGVPDALRTRQRGGRELVNAYADVLARARKPQVALKTIVNDMDREVRRKYSITADMAPKRRNEALPPRLGEALSRAELASEERLTDVAAVRLIQELENELGAAKGEPQRRRRRKKR